MQRQHFTGAALKWGDHSTVITGITTGGKAATAAAVQLEELIHGLGRLPQLICGTALALVCESRVLGQAQVYQFRKEVGIGMQL